MNTSVSSILNEINTSFTSTYKPQTNFPGSGLIWDECLATVSNIELMKHIIFCNDIMEIPPVKTFVVSNTRIPAVMTNEEKKAIGAFWGFVFKFVFEYKQQKDNVPVNSKSIKKAALFFDCKHTNIEITQ